MKRSLRATLAQETVAICQAGSYTAANGSEVQITSAIRHSVAGTRLCTPETTLNASAVPATTKTKIDVTDETTVAALRRLSGMEGGHLACLNFASAKNPGGGFLGGSEAQEESLARSSALYPSLLAAREYYERNRGCPIALYLDLAIWSPAVCFFRDDNGALLIEPFPASVITAPAPNKGAVAFNTPEHLHEVIPTLQRRAAFVLAVAAEQGVRRLVLGAWGCGVFKNDPGTVAETFAHLLSGAGRFAHVFDEAVFAIYDRTSDQAVYHSFRGAFS
jgi:uncharacterized protein (TIGR02452 family)